MPEHSLFDGGLLDVPLPGVDSVLRRLTEPTDDRVGAALRAAADVAAVAPLPGEGRTLGRWDLLARLGALDLTTARALEPHLDALAILAAAGRPDLSGLGTGSVDTWGVYAAEGPGVRVTAAGADDAGWTVSGHKPWCSLAERLSHALVTAWTGVGSRRLFAVRLHHPGVTPTDGAGWVSRGLADVPSVGIDLDAVPAVPVGADGWYLQRPGFAWGGMGVAACWYGATAAVARRLLPRPGGREPDQVALLHVGTADAELYAARSVLRAAAAAVDGDEAGARTAYRVRHVVARTAERLIERTARATGPAPLALEDDHSRRVADLTVYVRQEHAERDAAVLGAGVVEESSGGRESAP